MPVPNPVAFTIFGFDIMWYAILICIGIVLATALCCHRAPKYGLSSDAILNFVIICIPAGIIGARIYYVLFNWDAYSGDLSEIINIRAGGLAIHGGLIAGFGTAVIICLVRKIRILNLLDLAAPSVALAQAIGRWGNYFNSEAHGGPTSLPWAVTVNGQTYHPTFLYESIWCFLLFCFLIWFDRGYGRGSSIDSGETSSGSMDRRRETSSGSMDRRRETSSGSIDRRGLRSFEGQIILLYGILYSIERFFVEALRTDSLMIGPLKQAQVISVAIVVLCLIAYIFLSRRTRRVN